jgi:hypothetical protein
MIEIGDLCWDKDKQVFGYVGEILNHVHHYNAVPCGLIHVIHWNDGRRICVDYLTAYGFKYRAWHLHE